ncbi:ISAs1 family transposase [uncultured Desulfobacter sp.]|uniref:ISAs1 family transposase n=1 Tax=uncultured Desulfobacter sp. TaxID=240139 RepID=UPI0029F4A2BE|nr:ISAs1 family transposase [uncultured Desulfobacter sp.]
MDRICNRNNDYILALKENHKSLYDDTSRFFENMIAMEKKGYVFDESTTVDGVHGRIETRKHIMTSDIDWLTDTGNWAGLKSLGMVESTRNINGEVSHEKRYYISSLDCNAQTFGEAVRKH